MCLKPKPLPPIPEETRTIAVQIYPPDHLLRRIAEEYADVLHDHDFADLYSHTGQPALSPALLALVTVLQAQEHCSDRVAAEMVRSRIDWKYALHLPLAYTGFDPSVLCEFRQRLTDHKAQRRVFDAFLTRLKDKGFLKGRALQRTDSLAILAAVRDLNRLEVVIETLRLALYALAKHDPIWLTAHTPAEWLQTYDSWTQAERLVRETGSKGEAETKRLLLRTGQDGFSLLDALDQEAPTSLRELPAIAVLRTVWSQYYRRQEQAATPVALEVTDSQGTPPPDRQVVATAPVQDTAFPPTAPATQSSQQTPSLELITHSSHTKEGWREVIVSPHDPEARVATKRGHTWVGYKLHVTETASEEAPALITDVEIGAAAAYDCHSVAGIQQRLQAREVLPDTHLADTGYVNGASIKDSQARHVALLGPVPADNFNASQRPVGFGTEDFVVDMQHQQAICPAGQTSVRWSEYDRPDLPAHKKLVVSWDKKICLACPLQQSCLGPGKAPRTLGLTGYYDVLAARRKEQKTEAFHERYRRRAGIEATLSHLVNVQGARRTPYRGPEKSLTYYAALAVGVNLRRVSVWQTGKRPERERSGRLSRLLTEKTVQEAASPLGPVGLLTCCQRFRRLRFVDSLSYRSRRLLLSGSPAVTVGSTTSVLRQVSGQLEIENALTGDFPGFNVGTPDTGEPCAWKRARTVRRGAVEKGAVMPPRQQPTLSRASPALSGLGAVSAGAKRRDLRCDLRASASTSSRSPRRHRA
jgi:transposase